MNRPTTLAALIDAYRADWALYHRHQRSLEGLNLFVRAFGALPLEAVDAARLDRWRRDRRRAGISVTTLARNLATLSGAFNFAVAEGWVATNPVQELRKHPAPDEARVRFLSPDEEQRLRAALVARDARLRDARASANVWRRSRGRPLYPACPTDAYPDYLTPAVLLTLNTGLRQGELLALRWADVQATHLTVRAAHAKAGRVRHLPLNAEAQHVVARWRASHPGGERVVLSRFGKPLVKIRKAWLDLLDEARIEDFRWHDLRHHFASRLVMAGVPLNTVRELLGHASLAMTLRYAHLGRDHLQAAVERLDGAEGREA